MAVTTNHPTQPGAAAAAAGPHTQLTKNYAPTVGTPTSFADGATLDAGLPGLMIHDPDGHIVGIEGFDGGGGDDYCDIELATEVLEWVGFWGAISDYHPQDEDSVALVLPLLVAGEFNVELDFTWTTARSYCSAGAVAWQAPVTVQNDSAHIWSGLGPYSATGTSKFEAHVSGWGTSYRQSINGTTYSQTDRHKVRLEVSASGQTKYFFSPDGGSEVEHADTVSSNFINSVNAPHRLGFGLIGGGLGTATIRIYAFTVTAVTVSA